MTLLKRLYSLYAFILFTASFLIIFPFFLLIIPIKRWHGFTANLNRIWAKVYFPLVAIPVKCTFEQPLDPKAQYVFCPNHFSYLDIAIMGYTPVDFIFVGKSSISKVPLFGYMFKKLHIMVDRSSLKSKYNTFVRACQAIDEGRSLVMFPEGGIVSHHPPKMHKFKDGPFRVAIEKQIAIVPVTIPFNWIILPDDNRFLLHHHRNELIFHAPISTKGMSMADLDGLKETLFNTINTELLTKNESR